MSGQFESIGIAVGIATGYWMDDWGLSGSGKGPVGAFVKMINKFLIA
jgi:hypothetical protein